MPRTPPQLRQRLHTVGLGSLIWARDITPEVDLAPLQSYARKIKADFIVRPVLA